MSERGRLARIFDILKMLKAGPAKDTEIDADRIFRVGGTDLDIDAILNGVALRPYRIERLGVGRAKTNALHFKISDKEPATSSKLVAEQ